MLKSQWIAITGAPCSGKSSVVDALARRGYRVVPEAARAILQQRLKTGETLADIRADPLSFQRAVLKSKLDSARALPIGGTVFWDRGLPDGLAYYRLHGLEDTEVRRHCRRLRYRGVFMLQRLPMQPDAVRTEDDRIARQLEHLVERAYTGLGYSLEKVPLRPVEERVDLILSRAGLPAAADDRPPGF
jgi:predicted ATPase